MQKRCLFLVIAVLMLGGCVSSGMPLRQPMPPLDSSLAAPCGLLPEPPEENDDVLAGWMLEVVGMYGVCAARHRAAVDAGF